MVVAAGEQKKEDHVNAVLPVNAVGEVESPEDEDDKEEDKPLLSEVLNAEDAEEEAADFKNLYTDFKSKRLKAAFDQKRNEVGFVLSVLFVLRRRMDQFRL